MKVAYKLSLIVIVSITVVAIPCAAWIYSQIKHNVLENEKLTLVAETNALMVSHAAHLNATKPSLKALADLLKQTLSKPVSADDIKQFDDVVTRHKDGAWRSQYMTGDISAGIFLAPDSTLSKSQKSFHWRTKQVLDIFGNASKSFFTNVWLLTLDKSEVIYDQTMPDFVQRMAADNDYTKTPWMTLSSPEKNPERDVRWTPLLFDPVPKKWMISAVYPLDINGQWVATLGHDIYLKDILPSLFKPVQRYQGEQHFLFNDAGQFILAGPWQTQLEADPEHFQISETQIQSLFNAKLTEQARIFPEQVLLNDKKYIAIAVLMNPVGWHYYRLAPIDEVLAPINELFLTVSTTVFVMALFIGLLIQATVSRNIVRRLLLLAQSVHQYSLGDWYVRTDVVGNDEIAMVAKDFNAMISKIERQHSLETELLERNRIGIQNARDGICVLNPEGLLIEANAAFYELLLYQPEELLEHSVMCWDTQWNNNINDNALFESVYRCKDGSMIYVEVSTTTIELNGEHYLWCCCRNISERKHTEQQIQKLAHFDSLTQLPNRSFLYQRIHQAIASAQRYKQQLALIFIDLDHFKYINDTLGHAVGDDLLIQVAQRMQSCVREEDTVSRPGGDEFIIVLPNSQASGAAHVAEKLLHLLEQPYCIDQHQFVVTASIGIAMYPDDGNNFTSLSQYADIAMYRAKQEGRNRYCFFTAELQSYTRRILELENGLRRAIERGELQLHYQPQFSLHTKKIIGAEALLRWQSPELGAISPIEFIPIAENSGQIIAIGEWVLRTAITQLKSWLDQGLIDFTMAVNISVFQFKQMNLLDKVNAMLAEFDVPAYSLELELTESMAMNDPLVAIDIMNNFYNQGIRLAIDDFGTGYSSLSYLKHFKVHKLKIDRSFVRHLVNNSEDIAIINAVVNLAHSLGFRVIAEGVETIEQLECLQEQNCDEIQGYYFSKPLTSEQFEKFMKHNANYDLPSQ